MKDPKKVLKEVKTHLSKKVRLTEEEIKAIVETAKEVFGKKVKVWLFGSRVDLNQRGGDIDLYIEVGACQLKTGRKPFVVPNAFVKLSRSEVEIPKGEILDKKLTFLVKLDEKIGEQKVDLIIRPPNSEDEISLTAKGSGVRLL